MLGSAASAVPGGIFALALAAAALQTRSIIRRSAAFAALAIGVVLLSPLAYINVLPGAVMILGVGALSLAFLAQAARACPS
jgi:hypothetical protein